MGCPFFRLLGFICPKRGLLPEQSDNRWQVGKPLPKVIWNWYDTRCVLATLNSNMEVSLWAATKNHLKGEWIKVSSYLDCDRLLDNLFGRSKMLLPFWVSSFHCLRANPLLQRYFRLRSLVRGFLVAGLYKSINSYWGQALHGRRRLILASPPRQT